MTIKGWLALIPLLAAGWIGLLAGVMALTDAAPAAVVVLPSRAFMAALPAGTAVLSQTGLTVTLASPAPGLTPALYRAGAWLVLPGGLSGCSVL